MLNKAMTYSKGFKIVIDPYPGGEAKFDPVLQFACLDPSIAMSGVLNKFKNVILTSGRAFI